MGIFDFNDLFKDKEIDKSLFRPKETLEDKLDQISNTERIERNIKKFQEKRNVGHQYDDDLAYIEQVAEEGAYKKFKPDDREWKAIWNKHPELQEDMLKFYDDIQNERRSQFMWCAERGQRIPIAVCDRIKALCKGCQIVKKV